MLINHLADPEAQELERGRSYADFHPDRVAMQDATAQMALLQFMTAGLAEVAVPSTVHCDHLIQAKAGADIDLKFALDINSEVYEFLRSVSAKYGVGFWKPGSGIIHQVVLENYAFPGGMMIGTDSHTPNAGGLGMVAIGVGGADAVDVMTGFPFNVRWPKVIGVHLTGSLSGWSSAKDVILEVARQLTVAGRHRRHRRVLRPGRRLDQRHRQGHRLQHGSRDRRHLLAVPLRRQHGRLPEGDRTRGHRRCGRSKVASDLRPDPEVEADPSKYYDRVIEIDLDELRPLINGPDTPDLAHAVAEVGAWAAEHDVPVEVSSALIGSCTNSSYEDITRAASIARQAAAKGLRAKTQLLITPGSEQVRATIERDGLLADLEAIGGTVLANACGPCIGQWDRTDLDPSKLNTIVNSYNRNFPKRNDGSANTKSFVTSPDMVIAYALSGTLDFDPLNDSLTNDEGEVVKLDPPVGEILPARGFDAGESGFLAPPADSSGVEVVVDPASDRLQLLEPFPAWDGQDYIDLPVLMKAKGKCTTDHISAAGKWLKYRGHLENISGNLFIGVINAFTGATGEGKDLTDGQTRSFPDIAKRYGTAGIAWCAIGDQNYGEGSSPRARRHGAPLPQRPGDLRPLVRPHPRDQPEEAGHAAADLRRPRHVRPHRRGRPDLGARPRPTSPPTSRCGARSASPTARVVDFECTQTFSPDQIEWFRAGSALNIIRARRGAA